jgi:osmotically inducible lipoprotein OsmB
MNDLPRRQIMTRITLTAIFLISLCTLGACGNTTGDRAMSGGGIGAGVGALGGLMVGAPLEGALIGGAVGAGTGALTNNNQVNLGKPIWR